MLTVETWPVDRLIPYARNPRKNDAVVEQMCGAIKEFGFRIPIVARSDGTVVDGHLRLKAAQRLGLADVPVALADDLTEAQIKAFRLLANRSADWADWDDDLLALEFQDLHDLGFDLGLTGFEPGEIAGFLADPVVGLTDPDDVPAVPEHPVSRLGDVWILGGHRLICGDCTDPATVERVLAGVRPHLMVTDPPYGVAYDPTWRNRAGVSASARTGAVLNDHRADWREAWALFPGDVAYVWHGALHAATVADSLTACGFAIRAQVIWAKERLVMSRGHYHWQHEPCQPAGTMVQKVIDRGAGSQPARIVEVPIESLCVGDDVVSYNSFESVVRRRGRQITRIGERQFDGFMHTISAAGRVTRSTPEHRFTIRLNADAAEKQVVYLMRRGDWWRVGRVSLFNSRGFGLATRVADNKAAEAWIISVHDNAVQAQCAEQVLSCRYGIPTTHWEVDGWAKAPERLRSPEMIAGIYASLNLGALAARATLLLRDHRLERDYPFLTSGEELIFSRRTTRLVRACNLHARIMQVPMPSTGDEFEWVTITGNDAAPFSGLVYSMDVDKDQHYVADGLVTHNCWYAVRGTGHWTGDRKQTTLWSIPSRDQDATTIHGTQKPVECMRRPMLNNSNSGQAVYEPFSGSGTTIIAAETTGRVCHAIEISPAYVDVAVTRWQAFTGKKALLDGTGRRFAAIAAERAADTAQEGATADQATVVSARKKETLHGRTA